MRIPLSKPDITSREIKAVIKVLQTPLLSIGPQLLKFEELFAGYIGRRYAVGVNSGTSALHLLIKYLGIKEGDEVITTPFSFISSANCIMFERGTPVFVDIDPETLNIKEDAIEDKITNRTKAMLIVDVFGHPVDWDKISRISKKYDIPVIEDSCESLGSEYKGKKTGRFGVGSVFAFYPNKQITTGEGGMIVTDRKDLYDFTRSLRNQGRSETDDWLEHTRLGYNYRLDELSAVLGLIQLQRIESILRKRTAAALKYNRLIQEIDGVSHLQVKKYVSRMSWFVYIVILEKGINRELVLKKLKETGIQAKPYFPPIHLQPFYVEQFGYKKGDYPITESISTRSIALPFFNNISDKEIRYVCKKLEIIIGSI
ncbi:MAG TPA: DegT/DnrJ/EryC1/StrS family aminotransferase [Firmicutes bacterium]|nr:DegT/DnrJ/EryC1/StrS family aminotransferase [Bacillota bacterium]